MCEFSKREFSINKKSMKNSYSVIVAGSTQRTLESALALATDGHFEILGVVTPAPKPIGRKQVITKNPLHTWAEENNLPVINVQKRLERAVGEQISELPTLDFLLVVDFGYIVPDWLLELPRLAPINIHPSALPRWRGSSPAQFAILFGEATSATTIMIMDSGLDSGPILKQIPFEVSENWTQSDYYEYSFKLSSDAQPQTLIDFAIGKIIPQEQPPESPTPIARRLSKTDSFVPFEVISAAINGETPRIDQLPELLQLAANHHSSIPSLLASASRAFYPWPILWTEIPTKKGLRKMKLLELDHEEDFLELKLVHIEGHAEPAKWNQVKSVLSEN